MVTTESVTIKVPVGMSKYLVTRNPETELTRNALLLYPYTLYYKTQKNTSQHKKHTLSVLSVKVPCPVLFKYDMILSELKRKEVHQYGFRWTCYIQYRI